MKKLLVYLKDYKKESILGPLFKLLEASFELLVPLVVTKIIDVGIATGDVHYIVRMVLLMVGLALIGLICSITAQYFAAKAAVGFAAGLKSALFRHIQSLSYSEMDHLGTASLITRMTRDVNQLQSGVNLVLRLFLRSPFIVFGAMVMAFTIDVRSALVFAVAIPLLSVVVFGIMLLTMPLYRRAQAGLDRLLRRTRENLSGVRVIRAFTREQTETESFAEKTGDLFSAQQFVGRLSALLNPLTYVIINLAIVAILRVGGVRVNEGAITQGQLIALYNYMSQILVELLKLANLELNITRAAACCNRIGAVLEIESSLSDVQYQIESWQSQLDWYSNQVSCCTVYITLNEVETLTPTSTSFGAKLLAALRNGWTGFVSGAQAVAVFLVGAWPAILIGAVCGVIYYRVRHPRKKK